MHGHFHAVQRVPLFSWAYAHCCILYRFLLFWNKYNSKLPVTVPVQNNLILMFVRVLYKKQVVHFDLVNIGLIVKKICKNPSLPRINYSCSQLASSWIPLEPPKFFFFHLKSVKCAVPHRTMKNAGTHALHTNNQGHPSARISHEWRCVCTHKCIETQCLVVVIL